MQQRFYYLHLIARLTSALDQCLGPAPADRQPENAQDFAVLLKEGRKVIDDPAIRTTRWHGEQRVIQAARMLCDAADIQLEGDLFEVFKRLDDAVSGLDEQIKKER